MEQPGRSDQILAAVVKDHGPTVLATLIRQLQDFDLAQDAFQDAVSEAVTSWRRSGPPRNGAGWLLTVARRRAIDRIRRRVAERDESKRQELLAQLEDRDEVAEDLQQIPDERLRLIFICCHPVLNHDDKVALTLRTLCGLATDEIARAFLVSNQTMTKRLVRAKRKIRAAEVPFEVPVGDDLRIRLEAVLEVIYMIFNEGFAATKGPAATRADLCQEAIRLGRILYHLLPDPESGGLLALMLLHDARRGARTAPAGCYVPIDEQDRCAWNGEQITQGKSLLRNCLSHQRVGSYQIQAAISAVHCEAANASLIDRKQIAALYGILSELSPSPVVTLNHAVALANAGNLDEAVALLDDVSSELRNYQPLHAARAELFYRAGRIEQAASSYRKAIDLSANAAEREFLELKLANLG